MVVNIYSPDKARDSLFLSNYSTLEIKDVLTRVEGVGSITVFGGRDFSMRIWLDPDRLQSLNVTASDVVTSLQGQHVQVASGVLNQQPMTNPGPFEIAVQTQGRLADAGEFSEIVVKQTPSALVRLKDVARVELAAQDYTTNSYLDRDPAVALAIFQLPGSNALVTAQRLIDTIKTVSARFLGRGRV
jgi:multidrug efflux pump subunit AcrB